MFDHGVLGAAFGRDQNMSLTENLEQPAAATKERFLAAAFVIELRRAREAQSTRREET